MEYVSKEFPDIKVYYRFKKLTKNQNEFLTSLIHNIVNNRWSIYEFPPTLDKDFLYNSVLFSLAKLRGEKFVILTKNYDKIYELMKNFNCIASVCKKYDQNFEKLKIVPYFDRKMMCMNDRALEEASSLDFDGYCGKITSTWLEESAKCPFYTNFDKFQSSSQAITIEYENNGNTSNPTTSYDKYYNTDFQLSYSTLTEKKICPYYYYFNMLTQTNPDIIICTYKDFFDCKTRIQITKLLESNNPGGEYRLIFDECADVDNTITNLYSMNIDESLLFNAVNQLFVLKEKYNTISKEEDVIMTDTTSHPVKTTTTNNKQVHNSIPPENEFLNYNGFPTQSNKFPGFMRKSTHLINLISRLIVFFKRAFFNLKTENLWNVYKIQQQMLVELWLDLKKLSPILRRFLIFLNEIKFQDFSSIYHLMNFVFFINLIATNNEGFILNYQKTYSSTGETFNLELFLIEPHVIIQNYFSNKVLTKTPTLLSGGIGKIENFEKILKFPNPDNIIKKVFVDDNIEQNIYLTNISNTNVNNNSFYGEILMKLSKAVPDGIICYFSSVSLMEYYVQKWNEQGVFDYIMDDKLLFIEEQDSVRLATVIANYKKACDMGRGGILFLSTRNKGSMLDHTLTHNQSKCIIFIGFPIETKLNRIFELKLECYKKTFDIDSKEFLNYDTFKLFSTKIVEKVADITDKKVLVILDEKLISDKLKEYLPSWLHKLIHVDFDKENVNTDERLKNVKNFISK